MISTQFLEEVPRLAVGDVGPILAQNGDPGEDITVEVDVEIDGHAYQQLLALTPTGLGSHGGHRWWWKCPRCGKRRLHLYLAGEAACRTCLRIRYSSQYRR